MRIAISGTGGYVGRNLISSLQFPSFEVIKIGRNALYEISTLKELLSETDVVVHLAGAPILKRWTTKNKAEILKSRTEPTRNIVDAINQLPSGKRPQILIQASAVGIYEAGLRHTENSLIFSNDFVSEVVRQWESSSEGLAPGVRKVIFRLGVILGKESKTIESMLPVFQLGLGGCVGSGKQPFPFVHIDDVIQAILWAMQNSEVCGIYNLVAPKSITNKQFTRALSEALHRPAFFTVPGFILKIVYGKAASLLLYSPEVYPERLLNEGFQFKFPDIQSSLAEILPGV